MKQNKKTEQNRVELFPKGLMYSIFLDATDLLIRQPFLRCLLYTK